MADLFSIPRRIAPAAFTSRALTDSDNGAVLTNAGAQTATVDTGLEVGFGCVFNGAGVISFDGTATTTDERVAGATNPNCVLLQTGTDTYKVVGSKA